MSIKLIIFPFTLLASMVITHWFVYYTIIKFLNIIDTNLKYLFLIIIEMLFFGLFLSIIFVRLNDNILLRFYYFFEMLWLGFLSKLIVFFLLSWLIYFLTSFINIDIKVHLVLISLIIASLWSIWGVYGAMHPVIKQIEVPIRDLAPNWQNKKILFMSDIHLGRINNKKFAEKVVEICNEQKADLILITGDLFDGIGSKVEKLMPTIGNLDAKEGVYFVTGNHEGYLGSKNVLNLMYKSNFTILENKVMEIDGLQLIGLSFPEHGKEQNGAKIIKEMNNYDANKTNILLYHIPADIDSKNSTMSAQQFNSYFSPKTNFKTAKNLGIDLQLSGHTHEGQFWPYTWLTKWIYNGYHYGLHTDENFSLYVTSGTGTWGPPIRTNSKSEIVSIKLKNLE